MRILITGAIVLFVWMGAGAWWHTCVNKCLCGKSDVSLANLSDKIDPSSTLPNDNNPPETPPSNDEDPNTLEFDSSSMVMDSSAAGMEDSLEMPEEPAFVEEAKRLNNKTLYVEFGKFKFTADPDMETYASDLKAFLDSNHETIVHITGHTDDVGSAATNLKYGKSRARSVQKFFAQKGIARSRMKVESKGEAEPVADNSTEEGRTLNRRITVVLTSN